jgi:hypothetical protein
VARERQATTANYMDALANPENGGSLRRRYSPF